MSKLKEFLSNDLLHIISNDIIYYQRELKSQKKSISECRYERRLGTENINGEFLKEKITYGLKCIPKSSPIFHEFRIWQDIHNMRLLARESKEDGQTKLDVDVTFLFINDNIKEKLFDLFHLKNSISEKDILKLLKDNYPYNNITLDISKKEKIHSHRINLFANRDELIGNEILARYRRVFEKVGFNGENILHDTEKLFKLWHIDYSISSSDERKSEKGIMSALGWKNENNEWAQNKNWVIFELPKEAALAITKLSELKKEYGSFSALAIKKMLPVMRCGKYWKEKDVPNKTKERAQQIKERLDSINSNIRRINEISDDDVQKQVLKSFVGRADFTKGLNTYQAGYLIYDKHSEKDKADINTVEDLSQFIQKEIPNNSLRNPIVEQVVRETMFLVRDIWKRFGQPDEIHIELGRELKSNEKERKKIADNQKGNFEIKQRIKRLLYELMNDGFEQYVDDNKIERSNFEVKPNPESPIDIDKFRIWRSLSSFSDFDFEKKLKDEKIPKEKEIKKYALWLSQGCRSPFTGKIIPLSKLFDSTQYEIEHVIPKAKLKNDSFNNLVIAEWGINKAKGNQLAANFISNCKGKCTYGHKEYTLLTYDEYDKYCNDTFKFQKSKRKNLIATEVPEDFVERQLNDTRYITRKISELLSSVAKDKTGIIFTGGIITSELKKNWGLNKEWKKLLLPRFERLEKITGNTYIKQNEHDRNDIDINVPENPELELKRIDHRHHALDALVIAATTREHIRYLNSLNAVDTDEELKKVKRALVKGKIREFALPWSSFTQEARGKLEETIVSFKTNNKVISKPHNKTAYWKLENGILKKKFKEQDLKKNPKWMAVRRSMFKEPLGAVLIKEPKEVPVLDAFKIQIERMKFEHDKEKRKTTPYIYDKEARQIIKDIISRIGISIDETDALLKEVKQYLDKNIRSIETDKINIKGKQINKQIYSLSGREYEKITIAEFNPYASKRMDLTKKEYVEKLTAEKIKKDFPYAERTRIGKLFLNHLKEKEYNNDPKKAFNAVGLEALNKKAIADPKIGKPIHTITRIESKQEEDKFGRSYVEVDKGAMAYFIIYKNDETKEHDDFKSLATHKAIERLVKANPIAERRDGYKTIILSPNDLVYVPTKGELQRLKENVSVEAAISWSDKKKIFERTYKMISCTKRDCLFVRHNISKAIIPYDRKNKTKGEIGWDNKSANTTDDEFVIKEVCVKLKVDRLGNIIPI